MTFTLPQVVNACSEFVQIGKSVWNFAANLDVAGFSAFKSHAEFIESFGTVEEIGVHRDYVTEVAMLRTGYPSPTTIKRADHALFYRSALLERLKAERDQANGVQISELGKAFPELECLWRKEIDPCARNKLRFELTQREDYQYRWEQVLETTRERFTWEAISVGSLQAKTELKHLSRWAAFRSAMDEHFSPLGFYFDQEKSTGSYPVYTKGYSRDWHICMAMDETLDFIWGNPTGFLRLRLDLRGVSVRGNSNDAEPGTYLEIRYQNLIPGFWNAYTAFANNCEMATIVKVNALMFTFMEPMLCAGVSKLS